jgi:hypothetical protein
VIYITLHEEDPIVVEHGTPTKRRCMQNVHKQTATAISAAKPTFIIQTSKPFYTRFTGPLKQFNFLYHLQRPVSHSKTGKKKVAKLQFKSSHLHLSKLKSPGHQHVNIHTAIINNKIIFILLFIFRRS